MWKALHIAELGFKKAVVKLQLPHQSPCSWGILSPPLKHSRVCNSCQILLAQRLFGVPGRKNMLTGDHQQSKTGTSEDTQHLCKGQCCSPALPATTAAPLRLSKLLTFFTIPGHSSSAGERGGKRALCWCSIHTHLSVHSAAASGDNQGLQASSILFDASTAAV